MHYVHGTSDRLLDVIMSDGLLPPSATTRTTENRAERMDRVHILDEENIRIAGAYAVRACAHWGGEPIILGGDLNDTAVELAIKGKKGFPDIYTIRHIPPAYIEYLGTVRQLLGDEHTAGLSTLFKSHK